VKIALANTRGGVRGANAQTQVGLRWSCVNYPK